MVVVGLIFWREASKIVNKSYVNAVSGSGPACGYCFNVSLIEAVQAEPPFRYISYCTKRITY